MSETIDQIHKSQYRKMKILLIVVVILLSSIFLSFYFYQDSKVKYYQSIKNQSLKIESLSTIYTLSDVMSIYQRGYLEGTQNYYDSLPFNYAKWQNDSSKMSIRFTFLK